MLASFLLVAASSFGLGRQASLVTWNLLAPTYATQTKFPWASKQALSWSHRRQLIVQQLAAIDADVVCLQEVEVAQWDELHAQLHGLGYDGVLQETRNGHPVACATLLKRDRLACVRTESRSRAMITVAETAPGHDSADDAQLLYVANVHLEAGPQKEQQRLLQLGSLLKRLRAQAEMEGAVGASASSPAAAPPLVIAGDFNCEPRSAAHAMLGARPGDGAPRSGAASLKGAVAAAAASLLPLHDAYASCPPPWGPALRSTFRNGRVLDYIFTSSAVEARRTATRATRAPPPRPPPPTAVAPHLSGPLACAAGATHDAGQPDRRLGQPAPAALRLAPLRPLAARRLAALAGRAARAGRPAVRVAVAVCCAGHRAVECAEVTPLRQGHVEHVL